MDKLNKKVSIALTVLLVIAGYMAVTSISGKKIINTTGAGVTLDKYTLSGISATTTPVYKTTSDSASSIIMSTSNAKHIDLNIMFNASTTASVLDWKVYFSNDDGTNKNWYAEDNKTASTITTTHASTTVTHSWSPNALGIKYKNVAIDPVASKYTKVDFTVSSANGAVYAEAITQSDTNY